MTGRHNKLFAPSLFLDPDQTAGTTLAPEIKQRAWVIGFNDPNDSART